MSNEEPEALAQALALLDEGFWPVAIKPGSKAPIGVEWGRHRPTEASLRETFARNPGAGVGVKLGKPGGVIDFDIDDPETGDDSLCSVMGGETFVSRGWENSDRRTHLLARWDDRLAAFDRTIIKSPKLPGLEIRIGALSDDDARQLQTVVPPTPTDKGEPRRWNGVDELLELPDQFFDRLAEVLRQDAEESEPRVIPLNVPGATDRYIRKAIVDECEEVAATPEGDRNNRLNIAAFKLGTLVGAGALERPVAEEALRSAASQAGLGSKESAKTIRSGLEAGMKKPRDLSGVGSKASGGHAKEANKAKKGPDGPSNGQSRGASFASSASFASASSLDEEDAPVVVRSWPDPPGEAIWHGPAGEFARAVEPYTEADPVGILAQALAAVGSLVGRGPHWRVGPTKHGLNLFICTAGPTSAGRKGTAKDMVLWAAERIDPKWVADCVKSGLTSGEGLKWAVRDAILKKVPIKDKGRITGYQDEMVDEGVHDKRLLAVETEFGGTLKIMAREGNSLSAVIRQAWDDGNLRSLTKNDPAKATGAHITIVAHVTEQEINRFLCGNEAANGFGNRFLWLSVRRSKRLPRGANIPLEVENRHVYPIRDAVAFARDHIDEIVRDDDAEILWDHLYRTELDINRPGLLGAILGRAEPQTMRLACIYALLDQSPVIRTEHLRAALEFWRYCVRSAEFIFGDQLGDPDAEKVLSALKSRPEGMSQSDISIDVFQKHKPRTQIARILGRLLEAGMIHSEVMATGGRPATVWFAAVAKKAKEAKKAPSEWLSAFLREDIARPDYVLERASAEGYGRPEIAEAFVAIGGVARKRNGQTCWGMPGAHYWSIYTGWED